MCNVHVAALVAEYLHRKSKFAKVHAHLFGTYSFFLKLLCPKKINPNFRLDFTLIAELKSDLILQCYFHFHLIFQL